MLQISIMQAARGTQHLSSVKSTVMINHICNNEKSPKLAFQKPYMRYDIYDITRWNLLMRSMLPSLDQLLNPGCILPQYRRYSHSHSHAHAHAHLYPFLDSLKSLSKPALSVFSIVLFQWPESSVNLHVSGLLAQTAPSAVLPLPGNL